MSDPRTVKKQISDAEKSLDNQIEITRSLPQRLAERARLKKKRKKEKQEDK